jgi:predicted dehydrogenase
MKHSICFLGTGKICGRHAGIVKKLKPDARFAVASRDAGRARSFKESRGLDASFGSYDDAIRSDFQTIVIGVPPRYHRELIEATIEEGKNLLIEKPIVNSLEEFKQLWPKLKADRGVVMVGENHWFAPFHRKIRACLERNDFGKPLFMDLVKVGRQRLSGWRGDTSEMPMGALHEGGVHWIRRLLDLANLYEDDPLCGVLGVTAHMPPKSLSGVPFEDTMIATARHKSGLISRLFHTWGMPRRGTFVDMSKIQLENGAVYFDSRGIIGRVYGGKPKIIFPTLGDFGGFRAMWRHFLDCVENGEKPDVTMEDIFLDFAYLDAAYRSCRTRREEQLEPVPSS